MKNLLVVAVLALASIASAQTTNYSIPNTACQEYAANAHCTFTISGPVSVFYEPIYNNRMDIVEFSNSLGIADINSLLTSSPTTITLTGIPNRQGYTYIRSLTEKTTFTGRDGTYIGSTDITYILSTHCCSSGRGPSQRTVWTITDGTLTIFK